MAWQSEAIEQTLSCTLFRSKSTCVHFQPEPTAEIPVVRCVTVTTTVTGCVSPSHRHVIAPWNLPPLVYYLHFSSERTHGEASRRHVSDGHDSRQFIHSISQLVTVKVSPAQGSVTAVSTSPGKEGQYLKGPHSVTGTMELAPPNDHSRFHRRVERSSAFPLSSFLMEPVHMSSKSTVA